MATPISRDILNQETNARFWAQSGYKPGQPLDPNNPLDKAKMPVWMDIFRKVKAEADAGRLRTTFDHPDVAQQLSDAKVASTVATVHVDAGAKESDPTKAQQHAEAAVTALQVSSQKLGEAAKNQPPTVSPKLMQDAAREAAKTPPPPHAPAIDQIAHAQTQNGSLRPEDDPWDDRYLRPKSPREQPQSRPPARPSKSPRERPSREVLYGETNQRFWRRYGYKRGQKLDMSNPEDQKMSKIWMDISREVEREANEGRLTFTRPEVAPPPLAPPTRPLAPPPPPPLALPPRPPAPPTQQPWMPPPWMGPPMRPPMQQPPMRPPMQQPPMHPMQPPPMHPMQPPPMQPPMQQPPLRPTGAPPPGPAAPLTDTAPTPRMDTTPTPTPPIDTTKTEPTTEGAPPAEGMSTAAKIAGVLVLGLAAVATVYVVKRKSSGGKTVTFPRGRAPQAPKVPASEARMSPAIGPVAFPPPRSGRP